MKVHRGRREWVKEMGLRWDGWDALASKKWVRPVRMEDSGRVDASPQESGSDGGVFRECPSADLKSMYLESLRVLCAGVGARE